MQTILREEFLKQFAMGNIVSCPVSHLCLSNCTTISAYSITFG